MANNLKKARELAKRSQLQAAIHLDTTQMQISKYETGKQDITLQRATKLADYYKVSLDFIAGRTENPENPNL